MRQTERRGRRPDPAKDEAIIAAARDLFLERGYVVSMDDIAAAAGVSKQTLYARYPSKSALFCEIIRHTTEGLVETLHASPGARTEDALAAFGRRYFELGFDPRRLALQRVIIAEVAQFPEIAARFFTSGPSNVLVELAEFLRRETAAGRLAVDDADEAASLFMGMINGSEHLSALFGRDMKTHEKRLEGRVERAVSAFLRLFAPSR